MKRNFFAAVALVLGLTILAPRTVSARRAVVKRKTANRHTMVPVPAQDLKREASPYATGKAQDAPVLPPRGKNTVRFVNGDTPKTHIPFVDTAVPVQNSVASTAPADSHDPSLEPLVLPAGLSSFSSGPKANVRGPVLKLAAAALGADETSGLRPQVSLPRFDGSDPSLLSPGPVQVSAIYYLSPTGSDTNAGSTPLSPWRTPNHTLNCGDIILAAPSALYSYANFGTGVWGQVHCGSASNVAWLKCAVFDACKIIVPAATHAFGMNVTSSYWGVQGWEVTSSGTLYDGLSCFNAGAASNAASVHHIIFANNVADTCPLAGFGMGVLYGGTASVDYYAAIGNISYDAGTSNTGCGSGIDVVSPAAADQAPGTHIYISGNFVWSTTNPPNCWDGNGIILDSLDGGGNSGLSPYVQQIVVENNISVSNAGVGVRVEYNDAGTGATHAPVLVRNNTTWNNSISTYQFGSPDCGEIQLFRTQNTTVTKNLAVANQRGCYGASWNPLSSYVVKASDGSNTIVNNVAWSPFGYYSQQINAPSFHFDMNNLFGLDPILANPLTPGEPHCGTYQNARECAATIIAGFLPGNPQAAGYGYQSPSALSVSDPYFPKWLCSVDLPANLVTMGCK